MPNVPFTLKTFGLELTRDMRANVVFTPSRHGAIGRDGILVGRRVVPFSDISEATGVGVAKLAATTLLRPACHFIVSIEWLDDAPQGWAEINVPVHVPPEGGLLVDLMKAPPPAGSLMIGHGPYEPPAGVLYLDISGPTIDGYGQEGMVVR